MISLQSSIAAAKAKELRSASLEADVRAVRVAAQLRAVRANSSDALSVLFAPATPGHDVSLVVREVGLGLRQLREGPIIAVELFPQTEAPASRDAIEVALEPDNELVSRAWSHLAGELAADSLTYARIALPTGSALPVAERLSLFLAQAKRAFRFVLLSGQDLQSGVASLLAAPLSDGVVLCVARGLTTAAELKRAKTSITVSQAKPFGFVMDETPTMLKNRK